MKKLLIGLLVLCGCDSVQEMPSIKSGMAYLQNRYGSVQVDRVLLLPNKSACVYWRNDRYRSTAVISPGGSVAENKIDWMLTCQGKGRTGHHRDDADLDGQVKCALTDQGSSRPRISRHQGRADGLARVSLDRHRARRPD